MGSKFLEKNVGVLGRAARVGAGLVLLSLVFWGPQSLWGLLGVVPLATGLAGRCPAYPLLGIKTCSMEPKKVESDR
jgi:hypothetical protein